MDWDEVIRILLEQANRANNKCIETTSTELKIVYSTTAETLLSLGLALAEGRKEKTDAHR